MDPPPFNPSAAKPSESLPTHVSGESINPRLTNQETSSDQLKTAGVALSIFHNIGNIFNIPTDSLNWVKQNVYWVSALRTVHSGEAKSGLLATEDSMQSCRDRYKAVRTFLQAATAPMKLFLTLWNTAPKADGVLGEVQRLGHGIGSQLVQISERAQMQTEFMVENANLFSALKDALNLSETTPKSNREEAYFKLGKSIVDMCRIASNSMGYSTFASLFSIISSTLYAAQMGKKLFISLTRPKQEVPREAFFQCRDIITNGINDGLTRISTDWADRKSNKLQPGWVKVIEVIEAGGIRSDLDQWSERLKIAKLTVTNEFQLNDFVTDYTAFLAHLAGQGLLMLPDVSAEGKFFLGLSQEIVDESRQREIQALEKIQKQLEDRDISVEDRSELVEIQELFTTSLIHSFPLLERERIFARIEKLSNPLK